MNYSYWRHKILPSALRVLYRPWLISLGLHGLLLMMPIPNQFEPPVSQSPKPIKEVKITDLPASPKRSTAKPSPKSSTNLSKPTSSRNVSVPRQNIDTPPRLPKPRPSAIPTPKPTPATPTPEPTPAESPGKKIESAVLEKFLEELTASSETSEDKASKPSPDLFSDPGLFFDQSNPNNEQKWKSGIRTMRLINGKNPDQVLGQVQGSQRSGRDFNYRQLENYGGGIVYEVKEEQQRSNRVQRKGKVWYLNLVPTKSGTVVVEWKRDPSRSGRIQ